MKTHVVFSDHIWNIAVANVNLPDFQIPSTFCTTRDIICNKIYNSIFQILHFVFSVNLYHSFLLQMMHIFTVSKYTTNVYELYWIYIVHYAIKDITVIIDLCLMRYLIYFYIIVRIQNAYNIVSELTYYTLRYAYYRISEIKVRFYR